MLLASAQTVLNTDSNHTPSRLLAFLSAGNTKSTKEIHMNYYTLPGTIYQANDTDGVVEIEITEAEWLDILISLNVEGGES